MFSPLDKAAFERRDAERENLLDVLQAAGLAVLWLDNEAGCKEDLQPRADAIDVTLPPGGRGPALQRRRGPRRGILVGLDERIARLPEERRKKGVVLVMHQMGSHGPAYYKRSGPAQKRFLPEIRASTTLGQCEPGQLVNAYDNTIVATDHFLAGAIAWLQRHGDGYAPALLYISDHGESLGEYGIFLHSLRTGLRPRCKSGVPFIAWFAPALAARRGLDVACVGSSLGHAAQPRQSLSLRSSACST